MGVLKAVCLTCGAKNVTVTAAGNLAYHDDKKTKRRCSAVGMIASVIKGGWF